jgi:hypothetical protein
MNVPLVSKIARGAIVRRNVDPMHVGCVLSVSRPRTGPIAKVYWFALGANENAIPVDQLELATDYARPQPLIIRKGNGSATGSD